jgi:DNA polymerase (family 10)
VDVFVALREEKIYALLQYINSKFKNVYLRRRARALGCKLSQYGLFRGRKRLAFRSRAALLKFLGVTKDVAH